MALGIDTSDRLVDRFRKQLKVRERGEGRKEGGEEQGQGGAQYQANIARKNAVCLPYQTASLTQG
jgi:hypothetical protein